MQRFEIGPVWQANWRQFDTVIDVRAPAEFAEDHVPGAVSMPVLNDAERARVGTIYKQDSPFSARKTGAALVAKNAAAHIQTRMMDKPGDWRPLVYCWRGGQRSGSFATILEQIGWRVSVVAGGYKSYRRNVVQALYDDPLALRLVRLDGNTGTAKTALLARAAQRGVQVLDLEALAGHRGSLLGGMAGGQPAQKGFESALLAAMSAYDPSRPVLVEAESSRLGELRLPPALWQAMVAAPRILVEAPESARAAYLTEAYRDLWHQEDRLLGLLRGLTPLVGHSQVQDWSVLAKAQDWQQLARALIRGHYDPAYARAARRNRVPVGHRLQTDRLDATALDTLAAQIALAVDQIDARRAPNNAPDDG